MIRFLLKKKKQKKKAFVTSVKKMQLKNKSGIMGSFYYCVMNLHVSESDWQQQSFCLSPGKTLSVIMMASLNVAINSP